jgi:glucosylceramidase
LGSGNRIFRSHQNQEPARPSVRILQSLTLGLILACWSCSPADNGLPANSKEIGKASIWVTAGDQSKLLQREPDVSITGISPSQFYTIPLDPTQSFQVIDGFGAALTGSSAFLIHKLDGVSQLELLKDLFDPSAGIGISFLRMTIGASDFSLSDFTYDDVPSGQTDYALNGFSIASDQVDVLPVLKEIKLVSPDIKIMGSPWSPPAWMKTNASLKGGNLRTDAYASYANYLVRYIQAFQSQGIPIHAITPQNEPLFNTAAYPCMQMTAAEQIDFIRNYLGPAFSQNSIQTKILVYDHNWDQPGYPMDVLNDQGVQSYVAGAAFHGYSGNASSMSTVHDAFPSKELHFTEISGGGWSTDFNNNLLSNLNDFLIGATVNWSRSVIFWNLALDEKDGPQNNGCANCRGVVTINSVTGKVTRNVEYYSIAHFSKFVRPGAVRISPTISSIPGVKGVAFLNPDGERIIILSNEDSESKNFTVRDGALAQFSKTIYGKSVMTITWRLN